MTRKITSLCCWYYGAMLKYREIKGACTEPQNCVAGITAVFPIRFYSRSTTAVISTTAVTLTVTLQLFNTTIVKFVLIPRRKGKKCYIFIP